MNRADGHSGARAKALDLATQLLTSLQARNDLKSADLWQILRDEPATAHVARERGIYAQLVNTLLSANRTMISEGIVADRILYGVIGIRLDNPEWNPAEFPQLESRIDELLSYKATRPVDLGIANLALDGGPFSLGDVTLLPIEDTDCKGPWWDAICSVVGNRSTAQLCVVSYGRVDAPGDLELSTSYAAQAVEDALTVLRGISFPFTTREIVQVGIVSTVQFSPPMAIRPGKPKETTQLEFHASSLERLGPPLAAYRLQADLLNSISATDLENLRQLIALHGFNPKEEMPAKIMAGIRWIGEASKPDRTAARFAKLTFALENLIGGESGDQTLSSSGLTAMLAERTAFLVGSDAEQRKSADAAVRKFYGIRSSVVHGRIVDIGDEDLREFAALVRRVVWSLLPKLGQIKSVDDLAAWVRQLRYS